MVALFRILLVISTLLFAAGYVSPFAGASDDMARLLQWDGLGAVLVSTQLVAGIDVFLRFLVPGGVRRPCGGFASGESHVGVKSYNPSGQLLGSSCGTL
jgi:hypothetical protein